MSKAQNPPWLMWGQSQGVQLAVTDVATVAAGNVLLGQQGASVDYGRPDSWRFYIAAALLGGNISGPRTIRVSYDLTIGVGRGQSTIANFVVFQFRQVAPGPLIAAQKWTSVSSPPPVLDDLAPLIVQPPIEVLTAQSLFITSKIQVPIVNLGDVFNFQLDTFFAPNTHVRPEWYGKGALGSMDR